MRLELLRRWPPVVWIAVSLGSLLMLQAGTGNDAIHWGLFDPGALLAALAFATACWLALGPWPGHPRPGWYPKVIAAALGAYAVIGIGGAIVDPDLGLAAFLAGIIPVTGLALVLATIRGKTIRGEDGLEDRAAADHTDSAPGLGIDPSTPLGDTSEVPDELPQQPYTPSGRFKRNPGDRVRGHDQMRR
jgi:hypothetical protein